MKKNKPVWLLCLIDLAMLGTALVVFALFHHVIPTQKLALNLVSIQSTAQAETLEETNETETMQTAETVTPDAVSAQTLRPSALEVETLSEQTGLQSTGVTVSLSEHEYLGGSVKYYLADLWLEDVTALRTAFAQNTYGSGFTDTVPRMDSLLNAALCVNGDYYGNSDEGVVVRNGVIYRANPTDADILCLYYDGTMEVKAYQDFDAQGEANKGIWQAWTFGPSLLNIDGSAVSGFNEGRHMNGDNPRTVLAYYAPGHFAVLVVDGRGESAGLSLDELAGLCEELGFTLAYNLDGGKSSVMTFNDALVILIPNVNASLHRFFCPCALSLLSQRSSATLPFVCSAHRDKITLCFGCVNVLHQYQSTGQRRARHQRCHLHCGGFDMKRVKVILPHAGIVLSMMFMVFLVLDDYNPMMNFLTNSLSIALLGVFCLISFANSILLISTARRSKESMQGKTDPPNLSVRKEGVPGKGECSL